MVKFAPNALFQISIAIGILSSATFFQIENSSLLNATFAILFIIIVLVTKSKNNEIRVAYKETILGATLLVLICVGLLFNRADLDKIISAIFLSAKLILFYAFCKLMVVNNFDYHKATANFVFYSAIVSTVVFLLIYIFELKMLPEIEIGKLKTFGYITGAYGNDITSLAGMYRNSGYFYEPGVFAVVLSYSLIYYLFIKKSLPKSILLTLIIMSTLSFSGLAILFLAWSIFLLKGRKFSGIALFLLIVVAFAYSLSSLDYLEKMTTTSYELRSSDVGLSLGLYSEKPLFGWGLLNDSEFMRANYSGFNIERGSSNAWMSLLYQGGTFLFVIVSVLCFRAALAYPDWPTNLATLSWLLISLMSQNLLFSYFIFTFIVFNNISPNLKFRVKSECTHQV